MTQIVQAELRTLEMCYSDSPGGPRGVQAGHSRRKRLSKTLI